MQKHAVVLVLIGKDRTWNTFARQRSNKQQNITARQQPRWHIVRSKSMYSRRLGWVGCSVQWRSQKISDLRGAVYRRRDRGVKGGERVSPSHRRRDLGRGPFTLPIIFFFIFLLLQWLISVESESGIVMTDRLASPLAFPLLRFYKMTMHWCTAHCLSAVCNRKRYIM